MEPTIEQLHELVTTLMQQTFDILQNEGFVPPLTMVTVATNGVVHVVRYKGQVWGALKVEKVLDEESPFQMPMHVVYVDAEGKSATFWWDAHGQVHNGTLLVSKPRPQRGH